MTITDASGAHSFDVMDGQAVDIIDDTSTTLNKVWSSSKVNTELGGKAAAAHTHDDRYYTESETDAKLSGKVDKVSGKGLSTEDYTAAEKTKLSGVEAGADVTDAANVKASGAVMGVQVAGTDLTPDENGKVNVPQASNSALGVLKASRGFDISIDGTAICTVYPYSTYSAIGNSNFICKGTLENVSSARGWTTAVKTSMDAVAVPGATYYLGEQAAVNIVLQTPSSPRVAGDPLTGQTVSVIFYSGATAATLSITGDTIGDIVTPKANQRVEVSMLWDGTMWAILSNVMDVPQE